MKIQRKPVGDVMVVTLIGKIVGGDDYELFHTEIKTLINEGHVDIVLNMSHVDLINSLGIGVLVSGYTSLKKNGGRMKFCELKERVENIFIVTQLKLIFETYESEAEALASFR